MKERVLAVAAALVLIALAVVVRGMIVDDDGSGGADGPGKGASDGSALPVVACTPDLADVCRALAAADVIAADPPSLDLGKADEPPADVEAWITWDRTSEVANLVAGTTTWEDPAALGTGTMAVLTTPDALPSCPTPTWACLAEAGSTGTAVGVGRPATADGLARLAPLLGPLGADDAVGADEFDDLADAVSTVVDGPTAGQADAATTVDRLVTRPGSYDVAVAPAGQTRRGATSSQGTRRDLRSAAPDPAAAATVVLATRTGSDGPDVDDACAAAEDALAARGIRACRGTPADDGLAGLLYQVHTRLG